MSFDALDISASALYAQRMRMDTIASNIANVNTTRNPDGTPGVYRRREVVFSAIYDKTKNKTDTSGNNSDNTSDNNVNTQNTQNAGENNNSDNNILKGSVSMDAPAIATGVSVFQINEDTVTPLKKVYNPAHPDADKDGFVEMPNINIVTEMIDMISATRAYEANVTVIDGTKNIIASALRI
ncbi:MAG: flagellar basal body rod C-terminal domain-containing protein [bacterium]